MRAADRVVPFFGYPVLLTARTFTVAVFIKLGKFDSLFHVRKFASFMRQSKVTVSCREPQ